MSFAGLKKQFNKANQFVSEKIGGIKGTELDDDYVEKDKKIDIIGKMIEEMIARTHEYLQPNPATRARLATINRFQQFQGKNKSSMYPQPEGQLGDCMVKYGTDIGLESPFGQALVQAGEAFRQLAEIKYNLEDLVKQNFLDPLHALQTRELKEINHHRKKLEGRRLDFDCKKRRQEKDKEASKAIEDEIRQAEEKFCESKNLADVAMVNFLNADTEQIQALSEFISAELEYHRQAADIMETLLTSLRQRRDESAKTTKYEVTTTLRPPSRLTDSTSGRNSPYPGMRNDGDGSATVNTEPLSKSPMVTHDVGFAAKARPTPKCRALYDFEAMNSTELPFTEGQEITLIQQVDENWYEGEVNGNRGYFPVDYVEVLVPLP